MAVAKPPAWYRAEQAKPSLSERQHKLSREEQSQYEEEVEEKEANPWEEGQEAGPRASEEFFKTQACLLFFFLVLKSVRLMDNVSFTSRSDQDSLKSKQFSNKFIIIQTSQPMDRNRTRLAGVWLYNFPRAGNTDKLSSLFSSHSPWIQKRRPLFHANIPLKWWRRHLFHVFTTFGWEISQFWKITLFEPFSLVKKAKI